MRDFIGRMKSCGLWVGYSSGDLSAPPPVPLRRSRSRAGQSLIESCLVVAILCLLLFGMLQVSHLYMISEVLDYAATAGARAHSVGFNPFMVQKTIQVAAIPAAGRLLNPALPAANGASPWATHRTGWLWDFALHSNPGSLQFDQIEKQRIPEYLAANWDQLYGYLHYEAWDNLSVKSTIFETADSVEVRVQQNVPVRFPFHQAFYSADDILYEGRATLENHYPLYLQ